MQSEMLTPELDMKRRLGDRRGRPRFEIVGALWGSLETVVVMPIRNVSRGGALVQATVPLQQESVHHVSVTSQGMQTPAVVRVRHVRPMLGPDGGDYYLIGLEFVSLASTLAAEIDQWLASGAIGAEGLQAREQGTDD